MINNISSLILLCCTLFLAAVCVIMFLGRVKQKKKIFESIKKSKGILNDQYISDEDRLKKVAGAFLTDDLQLKITEIVSVEKKNCQNLMALFLDYHPAAIEMLPSITNNITSAYIDCIQYIILQSKIIKVEEEAAPKEEVVEEKPEEDLDEMFQYQALIEQLRYEKQDFADKYKYAQQLLDAIYQKYKDQLDINKEHESISTMKLDDIANVFDVTYKAGKQETVV